MTEDNENKQGKPGSGNKRTPAKNQRPKNQVSNSNNFSIEENTVSSSEGGILTMALTSIAILLSIIAIFMSMVVLFTSNNGQQQAKEATETTDKINSVLARVEAVENKLVEADNEGKAERTGRGLLELKKALLSFQEARSLIKDDDLMNKIVKIENEMKSLIILPEPTDIEDTASEVLPELSDLGSEPEFDIESNSEESVSEATVEEADVEVTLAETGIEATAEAADAEITLAESGIETTAEVTDVEVSLAETAIKTTAEETDIEATVEESTETISLTTESEASQDSELDAVPTMEVEIATEGEANGIEDSDSAVNAENLRH